MLILRASLLFITSAYLSFDVISKMYHKLYKGLGDHSVTQYQNVMSVNVKYNIQYGDSIKVNTHFTKNH